MDQNQTMHHYDEDKTMGMAESSDTNVWQTTAATPVTTGQNTMIISSTASSSTSSTMDYNPSHLHKPGMPGHDSVTDSVG